MPRPNIFASTMYSPCFSFAILAFGNLSKTAYLDSFDFIAYLPQQNTPQYFSNYLLMNRIPYLAILNLIFYFILQSYHLHWHSNLTFFFINTVLLMHRPFVLKIRYAFLCQYFYNSPKIPVLLLICTKLYL